jgi:hypothetical protein
MENMHTREGRYSRGNRAHFDDAARFDRLTDRWSRYPDGEYSLDIAELVAVSLNMYTAEIALMR